MPEDGPSSMNFGVTPRTERDHQVEDRPTRHPMMYGDGTLVSSRDTADAATVAIALKDRLPQSSEVLLILPLQRVAGRTQAQSKHLRVPARAMHDPLTAAFHYPAPAAYR